MRKNRGSRLAFCACASVIENLEKRLLLSAVLGSDGTLTVTGTPGADGITVQFQIGFSEQSTTGSYSVDLNGVTTTFDAAGVKALVVNGLDGNDNISVSGTEENDYAPTTPTPVKVTVNDGNGTDSVSVGVSGTPFGAASAPDPVSNITVGNGNDNLIITGGGSATVTTGNGSSQITGEDNDASLQISASLGTGQNALYNDADTNTSLTMYAVTSDGQTIPVYGGEISFSGRVTTGAGASSQPLEGATVYISGDEDVGFQDAENSVATDANGVYELGINAPGDNAITRSAVHVLASGYAVTPANIQQAASAGASFTGEDFVLTRVPTAGQPTVFGTTGSYLNQGNTIAKAVDGSLNTFFDAPTNSGGYVGLDYGSPQIFSQISYAPRAGYASRMVGGIFQGSNSPSFTNVATLYKITTAPAAGKLTTTSISSAGAYEFVRYLGPSGSFCNIAEMQLAITPQPGSVLQSNDGTLTVTGTSQSDSISVNFHIDFYATTIGGFYSVDLNGSTSLVSADHVTKLVINGGAGDDIISVDGYEEDDSQSTVVPVDVEVNQGNGNNTIDSTLTNVGFGDQYPGYPLPAANITAGNGNNNISVSGSKSATTTTVGNGNNTFDANNLNAVFYAGNGDNNMGAGGAGDGAMDVEAHVGTGHNVLYNGDDPDVSLNATASDGQKTFAEVDDADVTGRVYIGSSAVPFAGATVFNDANDNGLFDSGEQSTTTDSNGDYTLTTSGLGYEDNNTTLYNLRVIAAGYSASPAFIGESVPAGQGISGDDFVLTSSASAATPTLFGTSGSYHKDGNTIANAVDGNLSTFFDAPTSSGGYVALDYGSPQIFAQIQYAPRPGWESRMVGGLFQGSNSANFSNAVTLFKVTTTPAAGVLTLANVTVAGAFRYVRYLGPTGSFCNISEMVFLLAGKLKGTVIGTAGSYRNQGNVTANAFDGTNNTFFDGPDASGDWVGLDLGSAKVVDAVSFAPRAGYESRMVGCDIQASNTANFSSGVVTLATITSKPAAGVLTTLGVSNIHGYRYYRYIGPSNSYCDIAELEFIG